MRRYRQLSRRIDAEQMASRFHKYLIFLIFCLFAYHHKASAQQVTLPIFPGAQGFGTRTPAGSGRHLSRPQTSVIAVTNLNDSGKGSLRDCVKQLGPRVCVFEVSGRIRLATDLIVDRPYITIAGQTAPSPGILLTGAGFRVATNDVLIRHLQVRVGDDPVGPKPENRDGITVAGKSGSIARNVVLDHLSISWAIDENFDVWYPTTSDVTLMNSIVSEGLHQSIHPKGPHGFGVLIGAGVKRVSLHRNLLAHNYDRNPRFLPGGRLEFIGNVVYGWGGKSSWNQANFSDTTGIKIPTEAAFIGNFYRRSPSSPRGESLYAKPPAPGSSIYVLSNIGPSRNTDNLPEWAISKLPIVYNSSAPVFELSGILPTSASEALSQIPSSVGSRPRESNAVDTRVISELIMRTGTIKDCVVGCARSCGGYPNLDLVKRPFKIPEDPQGDDDSDGYTNLEELLNKMAEDLE